MTSRQRGNRGRKKGGRSAAPQVDPVEFWKPVPPPPDAQPIAVATDPTMVIRSLGDLPLHGRGQQAAHAIHRVLVRSSMLAGALAAQADLLDQPDDDAD